jgi:vacuolar-type H+-ATPase subunit H
MPEEPKEKSVITLGKKQLSPAEEQELRGRIQAAQSGVDLAKRRIPLGGVEKPSFPILTQGPDSTVPLSHDLAAAGVRPRPPGAPAVRPETLSQIEQLGEAQKKIADEGKAKLDEEALKQEAEDKKEELFSAFDFNAQGEAERILNNKKRRKDIESRCSPMKLEDLIMRDEVKQLVPIVPNQFEVVFRSATPEESLFVKELISKEKDISDSYALEKYSLCLLCCSLISIGGKELPDHRKHDGSGPDEGLFKSKLAVLMKKSAYVIADLGINFAWFDIRVRKLLAPDSLGNG